MNYELIFTNGDRVHVAESDIAEWVTDYRKLGHALVTCELIPTLYRII